MAPASLADVPIPSLHARLLDTDADQAKANDSKGGGVQDLQWATSPTSLATDGDLSEALFQASGGGGGSAATQSV